MRLLPLVLTACFGGRGTPPLVETPVEPAVEPAAVDVPPEPAAQPQVLPPPSPVDSELSSRLPEELVRKIGKVKASFDRASTAVEVAEAWKESLVLAPGLEEALSPAFEAQDYAPLDLGWLLPSLPGMSETYQAEGMALVFSLDSATWKAKASATESAEDDAFFELMDSAWGSARPMGWAAWDQRTWDYGGCSGLGSGVVLDVLLKVDRANGAGSLFAKEIGEVRERAMQAVLSDNEFFPRCDAQTLKPRSTEALVGEVQGVLDEVTLTDAERAAVKARLPNLKGQAHTGG